MQAIPDRYHRSYIWLSNASYSKYGYPRSVCHICGSTIQAISDTDTTGQMCGSARQASHIRHRYHKPACHTCSSTKQATPKYSYHRSNVWLSNASHSRYSYHRSNVWLSNASHSRYSYHRSNVWLSNASHSRYSYHRSNVWLSNASHWLALQYRYHRSACCTGGLPMKATPDHNFKQSIKQKHCSEKEYIQLISQHMTDTTLLLNIRSQRKLPKRQGMLHNNLHKIICTWFWRKTVPLETHSALNLGELSKF